jgi:copper chaperone NosL
VIALLLAACTRVAPETVHVEPLPLGDAACAVCGMVVAEQPVPRGQIAYRDGHHDHFCSLGDLRVAVQSPSPRGKPVAVWVEAAPADVELVATAPLPWVAAEGAYFVVGFERPGVMGRPGLAAADPAVAAALAERFGGRVVDWAAVSGTPFATDP